MFLLGCEMQGGQPRKKYVRAPGKGRGKRKLEKKVNDAGCRRERGVGGEKANQNWALGERKEKQFGHESRWLSPRMSAACAKGEKRNNNPEFKF